MSETQNSTTANGTITSELLTGGPYESVNSAAAARCTSSSPRIPETSSIRDAAREHAAAAAGTIIAASTAPWRAATARSALPRPSVPAIAWAAWSSAADATWSCAWTSSVHR